MSASVRLRDDTALVFMQSHVALVLLAVIPKFLPDFTPPAFPSDLHHRRPIVFSLYRETHASWSSNAASHFR
ncbi:hypothetical protein CesoFtcFv8_005854 [Champsocephalus esox]|uniref:Uncharacterized protein n=1 Tax=Champsocephalus esox TaxID=159716 RepID=A0AAN8CID9_9TELE|nr:hypothetical protein CesoFtcFv8_005854 [Champsocephalus esox]